MDHLHCKWYRRKLKALKARKSCTRCKHVNCTCRGSGGGDSVDGEQGEEGLQGQPGASTCTAVASDVATAKMSVKKKDSRTRKAKSNVMFKCPGACGSQFVWAARCFAASRKNHMAACCPQLIIGGHAGGIRGRRGEGEGGRGAPSDEEMACSDARAHSGPGAQEQKVAVAHLPPTSTSSGGSLFSMQDHVDEIFEFESALIRRSFLEDWNFKRDLAKHRESSMGPERHNKRTSTQNIKDYHPSKQANKRQGAGSQAAGIARIDERREEAEERARRERDREEPLKNLEVQRLEDEADKKRKKKEVRQRQENKDRRLEREKRARNQRFKELPKERKEAEEKQREMWQIQSRRRYQRSKELSKDRSTSSRHLHQPVLLPTQVHTRAASQSRVVRSLPAPPPSSSAVSPALRASPGTSPMSPTPMPSTRIPCAPLEPVPCTSQPLVQAQRKKLENRLQQIEKRLSDIRTSKFVEMLPPPSKRRKVDPKSHAHEELADGMVSTTRARRRDGRWVCHKWRRGCVSLQGCAPSGPLSLTHAHQEVCEKDSGAARAQLARCRERSKRLNVSPAMFVIENSIDLLPESERSRRQECWVSREDDLVLENDCNTRCAHALIGPATGSPFAADFVGEARAQVMNAAGDERAPPEFYGGRVGYKSRKVHGMPSAMATCMGMPNVEPETSAIHTRRERQRGLLALADTAASVRISATPSAAASGHPRAAGSYANALRAQQRCRDDAKSPSNGAAASTCSSSPMRTASHCTFRTSDTETAGKTSAALGSSTSSIKVSDGLAALRKTIAWSMAASGEDIESQCHHRLPTSEMDHGSSHLVTAQEGMQYQLQEGKCCQKPNQMQPGAELVGERVRVYWDGEGEWFAGHVSRYCARRKQAPLFVLYDDGDAQWENFQRLRWMKDDHPSHARVQVATARILQFVFRKRSGKSIRLGPCQELIATQRQSTLALQSLFQALSIELRGLRAQHVPRDVEDIDGRQLSGKKQIGRRLRLLWAAERKWFFGTVIRFCVLVGHVIEWDDREVSVNDLSSETFKWILEEESDDDARGDDVARGSYAGMRTNSKLRTDCCISCDACPSPPTVDCPSPPRVEREQGSEEGEGDDGMDGLFFTDAGRAGRDMQQSVRVRPAMGQACVSACGAFPRTGLHRGTAICAVDATREGRKRRSSTMVEAAAAHVEKADKAMAAGLEAYGHISHALPPAPCDAAQECVSILAPPTMPAQSSSSSAVRMLPTPVARDPKQVKQVELELARLDMDEAMRLLGLVKKRVLQRKLEIFQQTHAGRASVSLFNLQTRCIKHPSVYLLRDPPPWC